MSFPEFLHFAHESKLFSMKDDFELLQSIFIATNIEKNKDPDNPESALKRFELIEALMRMAFKKFEKCNRSGIPPSEMIEQTITEYVVPQAKRMVHGDIRSILALDVSFHLL